MKQRFDPHLPHQLAAIEAVLDRFPVTGTPQLTIEMETGTGKTYTYLRTALELFRRYGLRRFVVVVPSVAIREGVLQQLEATRDHFEALYGPPALDAWVHHPKRLARLRDFARPSHQPQLLIITLDAFNKAHNLVNRADDRLGGDTPLHALQAANPVVILDEPQSMETPIARAAIASLNPRVVLRYSATHRCRHELVHRLGPAEAFEKHLVKRIEVDSVDGPQDRIRRTIELHLARERFLAHRLPKGRRMKVLSLFFLDRVDHYVGDDAPYREVFETAYEQLTGHVAHGVHGGYFARVGGIAKDTRGRSRADHEVYDLILRDKARLLDPDEPVRFIWSHSALREGWDNPNVFQLCTLNTTRSVIKKRQELGRGLRLPLYADGERCHDPDVNVLTVIANEAYDSFARGLQDETFEATGDWLPDGSLLPYDPARRTLDAEVARIWETARPTLRHRLPCHARLTPEERRAPTAPDRLVPVDVTLRRGSTGWTMVPAEAHPGRRVELPGWFCLSTPLGELHPCEATVSDNRVTFHTRRA